MKTGVIVYIAGRNKSGSEIDCDATIKELGIEADMVETISQTSGHFDVPDAWLALTVKGMQRIYCMIAEYTQSDGLKLQDKKMRLCG